MTFSQCCVDILLFYKTAVEFIYRGTIREREEKDKKKDRYTKREGNKNTNSREQYRRVVEKNPRVEFQGRVGTDWAAIFSPG